MNSFICSAHIRTRLALIGLIAAVLSACGGGGSSGLSSSPASGAAALPGSGAAVLPVVASSSVPTVSQSSPPTSGTPTNVNTATGNGSSTGATVNAATTPGDPVPVTFHYILPPSPASTSNVAEGVAQSIAARYSAQALKATQTYRTVQSSAVYSGYTSTATTPISISVVFTPLGGSASSPATGTCTPNTGGATGVCTVTLSTTPGPNTVGITLSAGGHVIASFSQLQILRAGTPATLNFTANPVVNSVQLALSAPTTYTNQLTSVTNQAVTAGTAASVPLTVNAYDANGNIIAGTAPYVDSNGNPVSFALSVMNSQAGGNGNVSISGVSRITAPGQRVIALQYNGGWLDHATINVSSTSSSVTSLTGVTLATMPHIYEYAAGGGPHGIVAGPDGNMWFTEFDSTYIGRISTSGTNYTAFSCGACNQPHFITNGPDGKLWFTEFGGQYISKITTSGVVTRVVAAIGTAVRIRTAPDGNLWYTSDGNSGSPGIGKVSTAGQSTNYLPGLSVRGLGLGPDGKLWYAQASGTTVGELTLSGQVFRSYTVSNLGNADGIVTGPDGNVWIANNGSSKIDKIVPNGAVTEYSTTGAVPRDIVTGVDGVLYYSEQGSNSIGSITTAGGVSEYDSSYGINSSSAPVGIALGPDGNIWIAEYNSNSVAKFVL